LKVWELTTADPVATRPESTAISLREPEELVG